MKKIAVFVCLIVFLVGILSSYAKTKDQSAMFTGSHLNGIYMAKSPDTASDSYIQGVIDGVGKTSPGKLAEIYPGYNRGDVVNAVRDYYRNNPSKIKRPVVDVLLSGAR